MNTKRMFTLFKRELTDILRDKKTLFMMLVVPIIIYPLLIIGMTFLMSSVMNSQAERHILSPLMKRMSWQQKSRILSKTIRISSVISLKLYKNQIVKRLWKPEI